MATAVNNRTITAANIVLTISVDTVFPVPFRIEGFSADDMTAFDAVDEAEVSMGVDGRLSAGWIPAAFPQTITLQADSLSCDFFENWAQYNRTQRTSYVATGNLLLPATSKKYAMRRGFLTSWVPVPAAKKTLQPPMAKITWERASRALI